MGKSHLPTLQDRGQMTCPPYKSPPMAIISTAGSPVPVRGISSLNPPLAKRGQGGFADQLDAILSDPSEIERMRAASHERHGAMFTWEKVLGEYEGVLAGRQAG